MKVVVLIQKLVIETRDIILDVIHLVRIPHPIHPTRPLLVGRVILIAHLSIPLKKCITDTVIALLIQTQASMAMIMV
jgi:hypothetical protein